jgi:GT2 family glycosyltransferase
VLFEGGGDVKASLVSVVIPCRNEVRHIEGCVEAILSSDYPNLEVWVVDGMSDDGTREVLAVLAQKHKNVFFVDNPKQLTPYAFNIGVRAAQGEFVQIVGSRNTMAQDYISKLVEVLKEKPEVVCAGGDFQHVFETEDGRWISCAMESWFGVGGSNYRVLQESGYVDTVGVPLIRNSVFSNVGYFDEDLTRNQDDDFSYRLTQKGYKIYYRHDAKVQYMVRGTLRKAFQQYFQYGYFKVFVNKKHKSLTTLRQLVPFFFVLFIGLGLILSGVWPVFSWFYLGVLVLYAILSFAAAGEFTSRWWGRWHIQKAIFTLHVGYGLGYLRGFVDFLVLNRRPSLNLQKLTT